MVNEHDHPRDEEIAAFLDGALSAADRGVVARHLATCDDCRALLGAPGGQSAESADDPASFARRGDGQTARLRRFGRLWPALAGVAAAAILAVNMSSRSQRAGSDVDELRGDTAQTMEGSTLAVRSPTDGARVLVDTLVLRWASAGSGATYDVTIVDAVGDEVWNTRVGTTEVALPAETEARLRPEATYYWRVDAILPDLRTASSGPRGFIPLTR